MDSVNGIKNLWKRGLSLLLCLAMLLPMLPTSVFAAHDNSIIQGVDLDYDKLSGKITGTVTLKGQVASYRYCVALVSNVTGGKITTSDVDAAINAGATAYQPGVGHPTERTLPIKSQEGDTNAGNVATTVDIDQTIDFETIKTKIASETAYQGKPTSVNYSVLVYINNDANDYGAAHAFTIPLTDTVPAAKLSANPSALSNGGQQTGTHDIILTNTVPGSTATIASVTYSDQKLGAMGNPSVDKNTITSTEAMLDTATLTVKYTNLGNGNNWTGNIVVKYYDGTEAEGEDPKGKLEIPYRVQYSAIRGTLDGKIDTFNSETTKFVTIWNKKVIQAPNQAVPTNSYVTDWSIINESTAGVFTCNTPSSIAAPLTAEIKNDANPTVNKSRNEFADKISVTTTGTVAATATLKITYETYRVPNQTTIVDYLYIPLEYKPDSTPATQYTVTYNYAGATGGNSKASDTYTVGGTAITLPSPTKTGYTFDGWYNESGASVGGAGATYTPTADVTLTAHWTAADQIVHLQDTSGTGVYTGSAHTPSIVVLNSSNQTVASSNYTVSWAPTGLIDVGNYTATVTMKDGYAFAGTKTATYTYTITKATVALEKTSDNSLIYNGDDQTTAAEGKIVVKAGSTTLASSNYSISWNKTPITNAGDYTATVTLTDAAYKNYAFAGNSQTATFALTVNKANLTVTISPDSGEVGDNHNPIITVKGVGGTALSESSDYTLGGWQKDGTGSVVGLDSSTPEGTYKNTITPTSTNYNNATVTYTVGAATKYTATVTVRVDGTPTSTGIESVVLGKASSSFTKTGTGSAGVYTFSDIGINDDYQYAQVTIATDNRSNGSSMGTYEFTVNITKDNKNVYIDLYTARLTSSALETGVSTATVGGKDSGYVIVPANTAVSLNATYDTGYQAADWTLADNAPVSGSSYTVTAATVLTPHATPLSKLNATPASKSVELPEGYNTQTIVDAGTASGGTDGWVWNSWPKTTGTLATKITGTNNFADSSEGTLGGKLTVTLGSTGALDQNNGTSLTISVASGLTAGSTYNAWVWVYDAVDDTVRASIPITVQVKKAGDASVAPNNFTWDTFTDEVVVNGTGTTKTVFTTTVSMTNIASISSVAFNGNTLTAGTDYSVADAGTGKKTVTLTRTWLEALTAGGAMTITAADNNGATRTATVTVTVVDRMPTVAGVTLDKTSGVRVGDTVSISQIQIKDYKGNIINLDLTNDIGHVQIKWYQDSTSGTVQGTNSKSIDVTEAMKGHRLVVEVSGDGTNVKTSPAATANTDTVQAQLFTITTALAVKDSSGTAYTPGVGDITLSPAVGSAGNTATTDDGLAISAGNSTAKGYKFQNWTQNLDGATAGKFDSAVGGANSTVANTRFYPKADTTVTANYITIPVLTHTVTNTDISGTEKNLSGEVALTVNVTNSGKAAATNVTYTLSVGATEFTVTPDTSSTGSTIAVGGSETVQVKPNSNLTRGTYNGTLVITYAQDTETKTLTQSFTYTVEAPQYIIDKNESDAGISSITGTLAGTSTNYNFGTDTIEDGKSLQLNATVASGYIFGGWSTTAGDISQFGNQYAEQTSYTPTTSATVSAVGIAQPTLGVTDTKNNQSVKKNDVTTSTKVYEGTIANTGPAAAENVSVTLSGDGADQFDTSLTGLTSSNLAATNGSAALTVTPKSGATLTEKTYTLTATISYQQNTVDTTKTTAGTTKKEDKTKTITITFTVTKAEYTVTFTTDTGVKDITAGGATKTNGQKATVFEGSGLYVTANLNTGYRFNQWTITDDGDGSVINNDLKKNPTTFTPNNHVTLGATSTPIAILGNTGTAAGSKDITEMTATTAIISGTVKNTGAADATGVTYELFEDAGSGWAASSTFKLTSDGSTALNSGTLTKTNGTQAYQVVPTNVATLAAGTYRLKIVATYKETADDTNTKTAEAEFTYKITDNYFIPSVTVNVNGAALTDQSATVTISTSTSGTSPIALTDGDTNGSYTNANDGGKVDAATYYVTIRVNGKTFTNVATLNKTAPAATVDFVTVSSTVAPASSGSVSGTGTYLKGSSVTLTATPAAGYEFVNWTKKSDSSEASDDAAYSFTANEKTELVANFRAFYYLEYSMNGTTQTSSVTIPSKTKYYADSNFKAASPTGLTRNGYTFDGWDLSASPSDSTTRVTIATTETFGAKFSSASAGDTVTLYVQWTSGTVDYTLSKTEYGVTYGDVINIDLGTATASDGDNSYITYSYTGTLPAGLSLNNSGVLSGRPTVASGDQTITITAKDSRNNATDSVTVTLKPQKRDPVFATAEINPNATDKTVAATTKIATITAPYWNGSSWTTYTDSVVVSGSNPVAGEGDLAIIDPVGTTVLTVTGVDCDLQYTPASSSTSMTGDETNPSNIYNTVKKEDIKVTSGGSITQVDGPSLTMLPALNTFDDAVKGYSTITTKGLNITNNGGVDFEADDLTVTLGKGSASDFVIIDSSTEKTSLTLAALAKGSSVVVNVRPKDGLNVGFYSDTITVTSEKTGKSATATVQFQVKNPENYTYTVNTFKNEVGGSSHAAYDVTKVEAVSVTDINTKVEAVKKASSTGVYEFKGDSHVLGWDTVYWLYVNGVSTGKIVTNANNNGSVNIDLYQVTVAAKSGSTDLASSASPATAGYYLPGQSVSLTSGDVTNYVFVNWTDDASATVASTASATYTMPTAAKALTANYAPVYGIAYDIQGGTGTAPTDSNKYKVDDTVILNNGSGLSKTGYTFGGWHASSGQQSGGVYSYTMETQASAGANKTFYAVWVPKDLMVQKGTVTGTYNTPIADVPIEISNGTGNYTVTDASNGLPTGLSVSGSGDSWKITGTPTQTVTNKTVTLTVKDNGSNKTTTVDFVVNIAKADVTITASDFTENVGTELSDTKILDSTHANASVSPNVDGTWTVKKGNNPITDTDKLTVTEGPQTVTLTFTPTDSTNYNSAEKTITVTGQNQIIAALDITALTEPKGGNTAPNTADITANSLKDGSTPANTLTKSDVIESITVSWSPAPDTTSGTPGKFVASTSYTATITVTPKTGWKFKATDGDWKYNGNTTDATVTTITPDVLTYTVYFPVPQIISSVAITTTLPQDTGTGTTVTSAAPTMYTVDTTAADAVVWTEQGTSTKVDASHPFETGKTYVLTVKLKPTAGNEFATGANAVSGTVNGDVTGVTVDCTSKTSVTVSKAFTIQAHNRVGVQLASGNLTHLDYYAKTGTDNGTASATGRKNDIPYAWSEANNIQVKFVLDDGTLTPAENITETKDGKLQLKTNWSFVYGTDYDPMPENGTAFDNTKDPTDTTTYDGKNVYLKYVGFTDPVYLGPLGNLTVRELEATGITPTDNTAKLSYTAGDTISLPTSTAKVTFNGGTTLEYEDVPVGTRGDAAAHDQFYFALKDKTSGAYTILTSTSTVSTSKDGDGLYMGYTDINNHSVYAFLGTLSVAGNTTATVKIKKGADEVNGTTVVAEYGDVLTAAVTPASEDDPITGSLKYQWQIKNGNDWDNIPNATDPNYVPKAGDVGEQIRVVVTETGKAGKAESAPVTVQPRTITFTVKPYDKPYDGNADNKHTNYTGDDFILSNVLSGDTVTLTYKATAPAYASKDVDATITWPKIEAVISSTDTSNYKWTVTAGGSSASAGIYRLGVQGDLANCGKITSAIISTIGISVDTPNPGSALEDPSKTNSSDNYTLRDHTWSDGTGIAPTNATYNTSYTITVPVSPDNGYKFAAGVTATITSGGQTYVGTVVKDGNNVNVSYTFPAVTQSLTVGVTASGKLDVTAYYAKTGTHTANTAKGHKTGVTFAWDNTSDTSPIQYQFVKGDGTKTDAANVTLSGDWSLVYGDDPAAAKDHPMPANGIEFTTVSPADDVAKYDGKKVYLQYKTGNDALVAPEPVGTLTVKKLQATGITPSGYGVKLEYVAGATFEEPATALTGTVTFNGGVTALENTYTANKKITAVSTVDGTGYYYAIKANDGTYTQVTTSTVVSTAIGSLTDKNLYMVYTDINNNTVAAPLGLLKVAGNTGLTATIWKDGKAVDPSNNPAEYGDTLTAHTTGTPTGALSYQWQIWTDANSNNTVDDGECADIAGATNATYVPTADNVGKHMRVVVTEAGKSGSAASAPVEVFPRTLTFTVDNADKNFDNTTTNTAHSSDGTGAYTSNNGGLTLSGVVAGDTVVLTYANNPALAFTAATVGSKITWPAIMTALGSTNTAGYSWTVSGSSATAAAYRLGTRAAEEFGEITSQTIDNIAITVTSPNPGDALEKNKASKTDNNDPFSITSDDVKWKKGSDDKTGTNAEYSTVYTVEVPVTPSTGYVFKNGVTATVNVGGANYVGTVNKTDDTHATVTFNFPTTPAAAGKTPIQNVDVHFAASPVYGENIPGAPTGHTIEEMVDLVATNSKTARWYDDDSFAIGSLGSYTAETGTFAANKTYTVVVEVKAKGDYAFNDQTKFFFHFGAGSTVNVTSSGLADGTAGSKLMYYTFTNPTIDPSSPGTPTSMSVTLDANRYYYVTTSAHTEANQSTIPGSNIKPKFKFNYTVSGSVYYEDIKFNKTLSMNAVPDSDPDSTVLYYGTDWNYVAADNTTDTNAVEITNGQTFANEDLNGKHLYIKVGNTIMDTDLGILTVVKLRADSITPVYQTVTRTTATAADMLSYNEGDHFIDVIASANVSFNYYDGNGVYRTTYDKATKADAADTEGKKFYFELEDGTALTSDATNGTTLTKADHNGKVVYLCYTDVHNNEVRTPLGALAVDSTASTAAITVRNNTHANKDTQYGDELVAVVSGTTNTGDQLTYQWQSRTATGDWTDIASATDSTYTVAKADVDKFIRVKLTKDGGKDVTTTPVVSDSTADRTDMSGMKDSNDHIYADKRDLTVTWTWTPGSKTYDGTNTAAVGDSGANFTYTVDGEAGSDTVTLTTVTAATFDNANVGTNKTITLTGGGLKTADQACYKLKTVNAPKGSITALQLEWSDFTFIGPVNKTYDGTTNVTGHTTAENVTWSTAGDAKINDPNPTITVSYAYTSKDALGTNASSIEATLATTDTNVILPAGSHYINNCTISPAALTVGPNDLTDQSTITTTVGTPSKTMAGTKAGVNSETVNFTIQAVFADASKAADGVKVTYSGLAWTDRNYALTWSGSDTTGNVTEARITAVKANNTTEIYGTPYSDVKFNVEVTFDGGAKTTFNSLSDLTNLGLTVKVGGNSVAGTDTVAWSTSGLSYEVSGTGIAASAGTITVSPRPLTVTGAAWSFENGKYYDGNATINGWDVKTDKKSQTGTITLTFDGGIMAGDDPTATYTYTAALDNENVGDHHTIKITGIALTGTNKERYSLPVNTFDLRDQKIVARPVTVQFTKPSVVKDSPVTVTLTGKLVESDGTTALATGETVPVTAQGTYASTATVGDNINVTVADFTVSNPNYAVTKVTSIKGSVTEKLITSVSVTYTAPAKSGTAAEEVGYSDTAEVGNPTTKWYESNVLTKGNGTELTVGTSTFAAGKSYRVEATFTPNAGYAFATNDSNAITTNFSLNGTNYTVGSSNAVKNGDGTVTVMAVFSVSADSKTIQHINLALTAPVVDATKADTATVSSATTDQGGDAKSGVATPISVTWAADKDGDGTFEVGNGSIGKFLSGYTYQATITGVNADTANGWTLAGDVDFAVNGVGPVKHGESTPSGDVTVVAAKKESNGTYTLTVTFPKQGSKLVESVYVNTILPAEHGKTVPNVYVVTTEPYEATKTGDVANLYWEVSDTGSDGTWTKVATGAKFEPGKFYRVTGKVQLKSANYTAYDITENTKFFVGGEAVSQSADGTATYDVTVDGVTFSAKFAADQTKNADGTWPDNTVYTLTLTTKAALENKTDKKIVKIAADILQPVALQTLPSAAGAASKLLAQNAAGESLIDGLEVSNVTWTDVTANSAVVLGTTQISTEHTYEASFTVTAKTADGYSLKADGTDLVDFLINGVLTAGNEWINGEATDVADTARNISVTTAKNGSADSYTITVRFTNVGTSADVLTVWGLAKVPEAKEDILNTQLELMVANSQPYEIVRYDVKTHWNHKNTTTGDWEKIGAADESASDIPKFEAGELYQAVISVKLKEDMKGYGYAFTTSTAGYINDTENGETEVKYFEYDESSSDYVEINSSARATSEVDLIELKREFEVPATEVYVRVASDIPEDGSVVANINASIKKPAGADEGYTLSGGKWYNDQAGTDPVTKFEAGKTYYLVVTATPDNDSYTVPGTINGYYWDDDQCFATAMEAVSDGSKVVFKYKIRATQAPDLTVIPANATPPATKKPLDGTGWTSENFDIVGGVTWYKGDKAEGTPVTGNAEGETVYTAQVKVMPKDSVEIADGAVCKFNNNTLPADKVTKNDDGSYTLTYTFPKTEKITTSGGTTVVPSPPITVTEEVEVPVVTYKLGIQGITNDLTAEKVANGGKPSRVPRVTCIQEGYSFVGWSETDPSRTSDPKLVDPRTFTIDADKTFFAVYKSTKPATAKHEHYIKGYDTGVFLPLGGITRAELAAIIARSCGRGYVEGANYGNAGMSDIDGHWARSAIAFCIAREWLAGYPDGTFRPDAPISRQEFAVAFARMAGMRPLGTLNFIDTNDIADWAKPGVYTCVANGWVNGYPDGSFRPEAAMLRSEAVKIMNGYLKRGVDEKGLSEVLDLLKIFPDVPKDYWAYFEIIEASNDHEFYYVGEDGTAPPEHWTDAYVGQVSWGS